LRILSPPSIRFEDESWSSERLARMAAAWRDAIASALASHQGLIAMPMANRPEDVALFFALASLPVPLILLPPDPSSWRALPPFPPHTPIVLGPSRFNLDRPARDAGLDVIALPPGRDEGRLMGVPPPILALPGVVAFTSGSTGVPKPVYRRREGLVMEAEAIARALALHRGDGVVAALPLTGIHGLVNGLLLATVLGSELGLLERFEPRGLMRLFASGDFRYWAGTPFMADLMTRCPLSRPAPAAPPVCKISGGRLSEPVFRGFAERFGVRVRPAYGTTENGIITADMAAPEEIRPEAVGQPVPGIEVRIGDDPLAPLGAGALGRVWFTSPWYMEGYGFPPDLEPRLAHSGWWPTQDTGSLNAGGSLTLAGRLDDGFKTAAGALVNPAEVGAVLMFHPAVVDAVVTPLPAAGGAMIGAVVETGSTRVDAHQLHAFVTPLLPPWSCPHVIVVTDRLPRLTTGKVDRAACLELLRRGEAS